jgi:hypothetical protein
MTSARPGVSLLRVSPIKYLKFPVTNEKLQETENVKCKFSRQNKLPVRMINVRLQRLQSNCMDMCKD